MVTAREILLIVLARVKNDLVTTMLMSPLRTYAGNGCVPKLREKVEYSLAFLLSQNRRLVRIQRSQACQLTAEDIKTAAMERVFGFELLPAPFVVSHLRLGLLLQGLGAPLSEKLHERVGVYLTNALTGRNPAKGSKQKLMFPEMEEERDASELVKRDKTILVVLGNPPYYAFAGVSPEEEQGLAEPYEEGLASEWKIREYNLDELHVRFLRLADA